MSDQIKLEVKRGRRPGKNNTRQEVLESARALFSSQGFTGTTIRKVAEDAGVDVAQVMQFFRSKQELFMVVMSVPISVLEQFDTVFEGPSEQLGERIVRAYLSAWEGEPEASEPLMAMLRGSMVSEDARKLLSDFIESRLLSSAKAPLGSDAVLRAGLAASMLVGIVTSRNIIVVPTLAEAEQEQLISIIAPAIQQILMPSQ
ncbi:TetR family transcriptional regulator [Psychrobacter sp.]|uniref:TetR/AcrR family transcriptional regulator n=1 Tax=Psychrobacter sp. TaxID=56811 RepID=UPI003BB22465